MLPLTLSQGEDGLAGLLNQGATCYLNSLLQALYMTPELRLGMFVFSLFRTRITTCCTSRV